MYKTKKKVYAVMLLMICVFFFLYYQASMYPYKVARWYQPIEAKVAISLSKQCSAPNIWLDLAVKHAVTSQGAYSAQVAFLDANKHLYHCEIGYKRELLGEAVNSSDRFRYASVSKLITTSVILELVNKRKIDLNEKLVNFFPELTGFKDSRIELITISHLLNHSAGFNRLAPGGDPMFLLRNKPWCPNNLSRLQTLKLTFNPGEKQVYSNLGYCLLGEVIRRVTDQDYRRYLDTRFSLASKNIKFINDYYYDDEVRYDYRYEEFYNDSYLKRFDFSAISAAAGLSGSATALSDLLWDIHHGQAKSPFILESLPAKCDLRKVNKCLSLGVFHYQPEKEGLMLHYHEGYLPGSASVAVVDSYGGVTVLLKSGANRYQENPDNEWIRWIYKRLTLYYLLKGKLPVLNVMAPHP